jgi:hypothetical protein
MILYKYFPPERIDVLQGLKIRFSQPRIYNDPFELRPIPSSAITEKEFNKIMPVLTGHHGGPKETIDEIQKITYSAFLANPSYILWLIQEVMASGSLALCLTEVPDSLLMWAHYGFFHKGFVVGFDTANEFFTCPHGSYFLKPIIYQQQRPTVVFPNPSPNETYFTKSLEWAYEKEWRLFKRLPDGKSRDEFAQCHDSWPIYLFDLPVEAIKEIIFGCRMDLEQCNIIRVLSESQFPHANIKASRLSDQKYELIIS